MIYRALRFLSIQPEEIKAIGLSSLFALFLGAALNLVSAIPLAIFLSHFNTGLLPYIYVGIGLIIFGFGLIFTFFQKKRSFPQLLWSTLAFLSGSMFLFWLLFIGAEIKWLPIAFLIWGIAVEGLIILINGALVNRLFTLQQGKRLFGLIAAALATGGILSGFFLPLLIRFIGTNQAILVIGGCLFFALLVQMQILKSFSSRLEKGKKIDAVEITSHENSSFRIIFKKRYLIFAFLFILITNFEYYSLDLLFNREVQTYYLGQEDKMAGFFGVFLAVSDVLQLFFGGLMLRWIFEKFGIFIAISLMPIMTIPLILFALAMHWISYYIALVFALIVLTRLFLEIFQVTVNEDSYFLLYQPLKPSLRTWVHAQGEMVVAPLAISAIGLILIFVDRTWGIHIKSFAWILVFFAAIHLLLLPFLRKGYLKELIYALSKRVFINPDFFQIDKDSLALLRRNLTNPSPEEVIYVLQTIESVSPKEFVKELIASLDHPSQHVRRFAVAKVQKQKIIQAEAKLRKMYQQEQDPDLLAQLLLALASIGGSKNLQLLHQALSHPNSHVRCAAIAGLVNQNDEKASELLISLVHSKKEEDLKTAAEILKQAEISSKNALLTTLFQSPFLDVQIDAVSAMQNIENSQLFSLLIGKLDSSGLTQAIRTTLCSQGKRFLSFIQDKFFQYSEKIQHELVKTVGAMPKEIGTPFLQKLLTDNRRSLVYNALKSLRKKKYTASSEKESSQINRLLVSERNHFRTLVRLVENLGVYKETPLYDLLCRETSISQESQFALLSFLYSEKIISSAQAGIASNDPDMESYAWEVLLHTLKTEDNLYIPDLMTKPRALPLFEVEETSILIEILQYVPKCVISGIASAVVYVIGAFQIRELADLVRAQEQKAKTDPLLAETIAWTYEKLSLNNF